MKKNFESFRIFNQETQAKETEMLLLKEGIEVYLKINPPGFNAVFGTTTTFEAELFIKKDQITKAEEVLREFAKKEAEQIDSDHYLYAFTDVELFEVVYHKAEWSDLDVQIAIRILEQRGVTNFVELRRELEKQNPSKYNTPKTNSPLIVITGYFSAFTFTLMGFCIGIYIFTKKHKLPDGEVIYKFSKSDRTHGKVIAALGLGVFLVNLYFKVSGIWAYILN